MREDDLLGLEFWRKQRAMGVRGVTTAAKGGKGGSSWSSYWNTQLIQTEPPNVEEMDSLTGWQGDYGVMSLNETQYKSGTASIKMISNESRTSSQISKTGSWDFSSDSGASLRLYIYPHTDATQIQKVSIFLYAPDSSNYYTINYQPGVSSFLLVQNEWNLLSGRVVGVTGSPSWNNIARIIIRVTHASDVRPEYSLDLLTQGIVYKKGVVIAFDDGTESTFTKAYPLLKAKRMVATSYIIKDQIDTANNMTSAQLQELNANGWDIGNHSASHTNFTTLTQQQIEDEVEECKVFLDALGLTRASKHVAYPYGNYNMTVLAAMANWGALTGRSLSDLPGTFGGNNLLLSCSNILHTTTLDAVKTIINKVGVPMILFHNIVDSDAGDGEWLTSQFSDLLDWLEAEEIQTFTIDEFYRLTTGDITVNHK